MNTQLHIDFTPRPHRENNAVSQAIQERNLDHIAGQCRTLYEHLLKGRSITAREAMLNLGIGHLARRIKDLRDKYGVTIYDRELEGRFKEYSLKKFTT